eukprot:RCo009696
MAAEEEVEMLLCLGGVGCTGEEQGFAETSPTTTATVASSTPSQEHTPPKGARVGAKMFTTLGSAGPAPRRPAAASVNGGDSEHGQLLEAHSGLGIRARVMSSAQVDAVVRSLKIGFLRLAALERNLAKLAEGAGEGHSWATMGVLLSKSETRVGSNGGKYILFKLSDMEGQTITVFLFGQAYDAHMAVDIGAVLLLVSPRLLPAAGLSGGGTPREPSRSFSVSDPEQLRKVATSTDLVHCPSLKRNGEVCGAPVSRKTGGHCTYHVKQAYQQASRVELPSVGFYGAGPKPHSAPTVERDSSMQVGRSGPIAALGRPAVGRMLQGRALGSGAMAQLAAA